MSMPEYEDAFGKLIADGTTHRLDIPSHYPYNPERWRLFVDGVRQFPEYGTVDQYAHQDDVHALSPAAGESVVMETTERPRYVVGYEAVTTWALAINQALNPGDHVRMGPNDGEDGWRIEHTGSHDPEQADLQILRGGSVKVTRNIDLQVALTVFARYEMAWNWYNTGVSKARQTYTRGHEQINGVLGSVSVDDGTRGPRTGNVPIRFEVKADAGTSGLTLELGSVGFFVNGDATGRSRLKRAPFDDDLGTANTYVPVRAFRVDPGRKMTDVQLLSITPLQYTVSDRVKVTVQAMSPDKVTFAGTDSWSVPPEWNAQNNVIETRTDVDGIPGGDGTVAGTQDDPGGFQVGGQALYPAGQGKSIGAGEGSARDRKRFVSPRDIVVVLLKSTSTGTFSYEPIFEQNF